MQNEDIVWETLPERFDHSAFHGNGLLGCMIYEDAADRLCREAGRSDVTAHRRDNNRLPVGGMGLETAGAIQDGTIRLDLWNAESRGEIATDKGSVGFRTLIHAIELVTICRDRMLRRGAARVSGGSPRRRSTGSTGGFAIGGRVVPCV